MCIYINAIESISVSTVTPNGIICFTLRKVSEHVHMDNIWLTLGRRQGPHLQVALDGREPPPSDSTHGSIPPHNDMRRRWWRSFPMSELSTATLVGHTYSCMHSINYTGGVSEGFISRKKRLDRYGGVWVPVGIFGGGWWWVVCACLHKSNAIVVFFPTHFNLPHTSLPHHGIVIITSKR